MWNHHCTNLAAICAALRQSFPDRSRPHCEAPSNRFTVLCHADPAPPFPSRGTPTPPAPPPRRGWGKCRPLPSPGSAGRAGSFPRSPLASRTLLGVAVTSPNLNKYPPQFIAAHTHTQSTRGKMSAMLMSAPPPPEPVCAKLPRPPLARERRAAGRGWGAAAASGPRRRRKEAEGGAAGGWGVSGGYLDSIGRLLESDQHVPVSPAGRVPGSELRRGGQSRGWAERWRHRRSPPAPLRSARPGPPLPARTHTHSLSLSLPPSRPRPAPPAQAAPRALPPPPLPSPRSHSRSLSPPLARQSRYLHESLYSAFGYVQIGGAQMGALVHGGGRVYQEE